MDYDCALNYSSTLCFLLLPAVVLLCPAQLSVTVKGCTVREVDVLECLVVVLVGPVLVNIAAKHRPSSPQRFSQVHSTTPRSDATSRFVSSLQCEEAVREILDVGYGIICGDNEKRKPMLCVCHWSLFCISFFLSFFLFLKFCLTVHYLLRMGGQH